MPIVVDVVLKPEILDPQGAFISHELPCIGVYRDVRQGMPDQEGEAIEEHRSCPWHAGRVA